MLFLNITSFQFRDDKNLYMKLTNNHTISSFFPEYHFVHFENIEDVLFQIVKHKLFPIKDIPNHICLYRVHQEFILNLGKSSKWLMLGLFCKWALCFRPTESLSKIWFKPKTKPTYQVKLSQICDTLCMHVSGTERFRLREKGENVKKGWDNLLIFFFCCICEKENNWTLIWK